MDFRYTSALEIVMKDLKIGVASRKAPLRISPIDSADFFETCCFGKRCKQGQKSIVVWISILVANCSVYCGQAAPETAGRDAQGSLHLP